jgi:hypothetical protein
MWTPVDRKALLQPIRAVAVGLHDPTVPIQNIVRSWHWLPESHRIKPAAAAGSREREIKRLVIDV